MRNKRPLGVKGREGTTGRACVIAERFPQTAGGRTDAVWGPASVARIICNQVQQAAVSLRLSLSLSLSLSLCSKRPSAVGPARARRHSRVSRGPNPRRAGLRGSPGPITAPITAIAAAGRAVPRAGLRAPRRGVAIGTGGRGPRRHGTLGSRLGRGADRQWSATAKPEIAARIHGA
jgi:hypothetical protein